MHLDVTEHPPPSLPPSFRQALLIMHLDVTERTKAEAALTDLTEAQVWISVNMCVDCMPSVN